MATTSPKFTLQALDFLKSLAVAALSQPILVILTSLAAGSFNINWTEQWHLAVASISGYLIKNFFTGTPPSASGGNSLLKIIILVVMVGGICGTCGAQTTVPKTDSIYYSWGFGLNVAPAGFTFDGTYHIGAGASFGYKKADSNYITHAVKVKHSFNLVYVPLVTGQPITSIKSFSMVGLTYGFNNDLFHIGPFYYPPGVAFKNYFGIMFLGGINL